MNPVFSTNRSLSVLLSIAACVIIIAGMRAAATILVPFLLSAFIAIIAAPPMFWLQRHKVPAGLAILIIIIAIIGLTVLLMTFIGNSVNDFSIALPDYQGRIKSPLILGHSFMPEFMGVMGCT